jgi:hypothetical protein
MPLPRKPSSRSVLEYLKLEETDETSEILLATSLVYLGTHASDGRTAHFWSYPTEDGLGWVSLDDQGALGTVTDAPASVLALTPARADHKVRQKSKAGQIPVDRTKRQAPRCIPFNSMPVLRTYPIVREAISFDQAVAAFGARPKKSKYSHVVEREFCVHLTSGRYARLSCREDFPHLVEISIELHDTEDGAGVGFFYYDDMCEVFRQMGRNFDKPEDDSLFREPVLNFVFEA